LGFNEVSDAVQRDVTVHHAEGVLAALLDIPIDEAIVSLELKAQFGGVSLTDAAHQVLEDHEKRILDAAPPEIGDQALAILRLHLDRAGSPLEGPSR
jgi:hypothetical protein